MIDSHSGVGCELKTYSITRDKHHWIHATSYSNNQYNGQTIVIHDHCAYDYCRDNTDSLTFHLETPVTIVAGMLLVGLLMVLNFTVSTGTINGLIFYANIVRANQAVFLRNHNFVLKHIHCMA